MNKNIVKLAAAALMLSSFTSCIQEYEPQRGYASQDQVDKAPTAFASLTNALTSSLCGNYPYMGTSGNYAHDFGYPSTMIMRDISGQDFAPVDASGYEWWNSWYQGDVSLGPGYANNQMPWTYYFGWIKNCNTVIKTAGTEPTEDKYSGLGQAYAMRALCYLDVVRWYGAKTYAADKQALTVPKVTEETDATSDNNPRMTNEEAFQFILSDLDQAEKYLANYTRSDKYTPDLSVVYGLKARAYLTMEDWANAEKYAKLAQQGYSVMSADEYTSHTDGFNSPNEAWMFAVRFQSTDLNVTFNDGDGSWGSKMITESASGCGYAANYGFPLSIDAHLYNSMPATDCRKKCFIDPSVDEIEVPTKKDDDGNVVPDEDAYNALIVKALEPYSDYPSVLAQNKPFYGYVEVKFRNAGGAAGVASQYVGFCVAVPLMRVEEMKLIEAEAVGMQSGREQEGINLLTAFAKTRDPQYVYGQHNEAYGSTRANAFQNEVWWQRRVEFWGEGLSMFDIKRQERNIHRSYTGTNHVEMYRWNTTGVPSWMNYCLPASETAYNKGITTNNPSPSAPSGDSPVSDDFSK